MIGTSHPALDRLAVELALRSGPGIARAAVSEWLGRVAAVGTPRDGDGPDRRHGHRPRRWQCRRAGPQLIVSRSRLDPGAARPGPNGRDDECRLVPPRPASARPPRADRCASRQQPDRPPVRDRRASPGRTPARPIACGSCAAAYPRWRSRSRSAGHRCPSCAAIRRSRAGVRGSRRSGASSPAATTRHTAARDDRSLRPSVGAASRGPRSRVCWSTNRRMSPRPKASRSACSAHFAEPGSIRSNAPYWPPRCDRGCQPSRRRAGSRTSSKRSLRAPTSRCYRSRGGRRSGAPRSLDRLAGARALRDGPRPAGPRWDVAPRPGSALGAALAD